MVPSLLSLLRKSTSEECQMLDYPAFRSCLFVFPCVEEEPVLIKRFQKTVLGRLTMDQPIGLVGFNFLE